MAPTFEVPEDAGVTLGGPHMLHGDPHHSGRAHGRLPRAPTVAWTLHLDGPVEGQPVLSPDERTVYVATLGGTLWAVDRDGHTRFKVPLGGRAYATPCVGPDGRVYVGRDGGAFLAIDPEGNVAWRLETPGDADSGAVLTEDGVVVFAAGSRVYGVRHGGTIAFRFQARKKVFSAPAVVDSPTGARSIVFGSQDNHLYALAGDGTLRWSVDLGQDVDASPAIGDDGAIFVGTDGDVAVRVSDDGRVIWRTPVGGMVRGALSLARNGDVLAGVYGPSPGVVRIAAASGDVLMKANTGGGGVRESGVLGGPVEDDDGTIVFGGADGFVRALGRDGVERWTYDAHSEVDAPVTLLPDGSLFVGTYDGDLVAFAPTGAVPQGR